MTRFYEKNKILFAVFWILAYVIGSMLTDQASETIGIPQILTLPLLLAICAALLGWMISGRRMQQFGLTLPQANSKACLYFLPLAALSCVNLLGGALSQFSLPERGAEIGCMLLVGIVEELIFRGLLFTAMREENLNAAVLVSGLTFGLGHIVNLLNGAPFFSTLLQIGYAVALGLVFTLIFHCTGSLIPCILSHAFIDVSACFLASDALAPAMETGLSAALTLLSLAYAASIWKICNPSAK